MYFPLLLSLAFLAFYVQAQNEFVNIPSNFSYTTSIEIHWIDERNSFITGLSVRGVQDPPELVELPLGDDCVDREVDPGKAPTCVKWVNNGTATFGGESAAELSDARMYFFHLDWVLGDELRGNSTSSPFRMVTADSFIPSPPVAGSASTSTKPAPSRSLLPTTIATSLMPSTTTPSSTNPDSITSTSTVPNSRAAKKVLSKGAIIGISIGGAALILITLIAFLLWRRRRKAPAKPTPKEIYADSSYTDHSPTTNRSIPNTSSYPAPEIGATAYTQLHHPIPNRDRAQTQTQNRTPSRIPAPASAPQHTHPVAPPPIPNSPPRPASQGSSRFAPSRQPSIDEEREMSPEELARLDDEERRIDEAIRESERARGVGS